MLAIGSRSAAAATAAGAPFAAKSKPQVRQNCMFLALSPPQRGQRAALAAGAGEAAATDGPFWPMGAPQAWQNAFCGGFSRWH